jgi:hypothetical protein
MQEASRSEKDTAQTIFSPIHEKRRGRERRKEPSCGFTCITIVGWICRREQLRRNDDSAGYNIDNP